MLTDHKQLVIDNGASKEPKNIHRSAPLLPSVSQGEIQAMSVMVIRGNSAALSGQVQHSTNNGTKHKHQRPTSTCHVVEKRCSDIVLFEDGWILISSASS